MKFRITVQAMDDEAKILLTDPVNYEGSGYVLLMADDDKPFMSELRHMSIDKISECLRFASRPIRAATHLAKGKIDADHFLDYSDVDYE